MDLKEIPGASDAKNRGNHLDGGAFHCAEACIAG